jgi:hypothetical protein
VPFFANPVRRLPAVVTAKIDDLPAVFLSLLRCCKEEIGKTSTETGSLTFCVETVVMPAPDFGRG